MLLCPTPLQTLQYQPDDKMKKTINEQDEKEKEEKRNLPKCSQVKEQDEKAGIIFWIGWFAGWFLLLTTFYLGTLFSEKALTPNDFLFPSLVSLLLFLIYIFRALFIKNKERKSK